MAQHTLRFNLSLLLSLQVFSPLHGSYLKKTRISISNLKLFVNSEPKHLLVTSLLQYAPSSRQAAKPRTLILQVHLEALGYVGALGPSVQLEACRKVARRAAKLDGCSVMPRTDAVSIRRGSVAVHFCVVSA